ncbi:lysophospholipid acyltransferase family protein [Helicobacter sp.]|uniref:lysophospholipid acyltransferase family protein n=1 Tax=Helicobacter sp. TaxID=218 RepID=UPI0019AF7E85|nr:lysophospholipid acyltransferase family protein [Helicobacter sp.]MBD5165651.1 lysophospholipid acyltransferase family protein [Helicobacter sp.]
MNGIRDKIKFLNLKISKEKKRKILIQLLPPIFAFMIKILPYFVRFEFRVSSEVLDKIAEKQVFIVAFWHGELLLQSLICNKFLNRHQKVSVLISQHFDGELIARVIRYFGIDSLRGSSSKGGAKALLEAIKKIKQNEYIIITPDGPSGPYHSVADGIVLLAQKSKVPIVISRVLYQNFWEFKSWDRFRIPKPFSKVICVIKEPLNIESLELEEAKNLIQSKMEED